jgi:hypothetical protein
MYSISTTPCLFCQTPIPVPPTGRLPKYCSDAHRIAHKRASKEALATAKSQPKPQTQPSKDQRLIDSNGIDYSIPEAVLPPNIWPYMPVQSHQSIDDLKTQSRAPSKPAPWD